MRAHTSFLPRATATVHTTTTISAAAATALQSPQLYRPSPKGLLLAALLLVLFAKTSHALPPAVITTGETKEGINAAAGSRSSKEEGVILETSNGLLRGFRYRLSPANADSVDALDVKSADIFLSIPYAQPPVEALRFERPAPVKNWTDVRDATEIPSACVPVHMFAAPDFNEDCLYLNLFRPSLASSTTDAAASRPVPGEMNDFSKRGARDSASKEQSPPTPLLPILVFIHGGGFNVGGTFAEGYRSLSENFVSRGIIVITIQYRLNAFGFFSDGVKGGRGLQGNLGLWDQREALLWVHRNARFFNGDASRITVWGQSAGAASVALLSASRQTRDLFHQAIEQSGSFLAPWAFNERVVESSLELANNQLGCAGPNATTASPAMMALENAGGVDKSAAMKACLKRASTEDFLFGIANMDLIRPDFEITIFNPHVDADFFSGHSSIASLLVEASTSRKPTMMSFNPQEALFLTIEYPDSIFAIHGPHSVEAVNGSSELRFSREQLVKFIETNVRPKLGSHTSVPKPVASQLQKELIAMYAPKNSKNSENYLEAYTQLLSDVLFIVPAVWEARLKSRLGWPVYLYEFDHLSAKEKSKLPFRGVVHTAEYPYTVGTSIFGNPAMDADDRRVKELLLDSIAAFVKKGDPSTEKLNWPSHIQPLNASTAGGESPNASAALEFVRIRDGEAEVLDLKTMPDDGSPGGGLAKRIAKWDALSRRFNLAGFQGLPPFNSTKWAGMVNKL